jgi:hypothetical protein
MKVSKKSEMELSFPLVDILGVPISLEGDRLFGTLKKKLRLGYGASLPLEGAVEGVADKPRQRSTVTGQVIDRLNLVLRHDGASASESLWLYSSSLVPSLKTNDLNHEDEWFDKKLAGMDGLVKFKRTPQSKKWVRV